MNSFDRCFDKLMILEDIIYTDDPNDHGGPTKFGLSALGYPNEDIENLTVERAKAIYENDYWIPAGCDEIKNEKMQFQLFECAVHMDPPRFTRRSTLVVQVALGILGVTLDWDGIMGPKTIKAINSYKHQSSLVDTANVIQAMFLVVGSKGTSALLTLIRERLPQLNLYFRGWMRRIELDRPIGVV